jgi:hypothetical protein
MTVPRGARWVTALTAIGLAGCAGAAAGVATVTATPLHALLGIDQLGDPGFTVYTAPHQESAVQVAGSAAGASRLDADGWLSAASVRYTRQEDFSVADGPVDVISTAERFASAGGAAAAFSDAVASLDAMPGVTQISTGPLGDAAHAVQLVRPLPTGLSAVQYTVEWRVANMLNVLVIRGRNGGTSIEDALGLCYAQDDNEPVSPPSS